VHNILRRCCKFLEHFILFYFTFADGFILLHLLWDVFVTGNLTSCRDFMSTYVECSWCRWSCLCMNTGSRWSDPCMFHHWDTDLTHTRPPLYSQTHTHTHTRLQYDIMRLMWDSLWFSVMHTQHTCKTTSHSIIRLVLFLLWNNDNHCIHLQASTTETWWVTATMQLQVHYSYKTPLCQPSHLKPKQIRLLRRCCPW